MNILDFILGFIIGLWLMRKIKNKTIKWQADWLNYYSKLLNKRNKK